jgi:hypothetical protein
MYQTKHGLSRKEHLLSKEHHFWALVDFLPRIDEFIRTQDGKYCRVTLVCHSVRPFDLPEDVRAFMLVPWVAAVLDDNEETVF